MAQKTTINLVDWRRSINKARWGFDDEGVFSPFYVESIKNSIDYTAGTYVSEITVRSLIHLNWNVNIRAPKESDYK